MYDLKIFYVLLQLLMRMMACVVEWCLKIPVHSMLETSESDKGCLFNVFQVRL